MATGLQVRDQLNQQTIGAGRGQGRGVATIRAGPKGLEQGRDLRWWSGAVLERAGTWCGRGLLEAEPDLGGAGHTSGQGWTL